MIKPNNRAFARGKTGQPRFARGNAFPPFGALRHHLPPAERWDNKGPQSSPFISNSQHNGALFCPLHRGKSGEAGKGEASAASQSAGCQSSPMTLKANPVTLTLYLSPVRAIPQPSGPQGPSNLRTLRPIGPVNPKNLPS